MKIISIDPGYERVGIAILEKNTKGEKEVVVYSECFKTNKDDNMNIRIFLIGQEISKLIEEYKPEFMVIEKLFFETNQKTAMGVSEIRGVLIYEATRRGLGVYEYTPPQIKLAVTGYGKATKDDVFFMVNKLVEIDEKKRLDDEIDAIAVGITFFAIENMLIK